MTRRCVRRAAGSLVVALALFAVSDNVLADIAADGLSAAQARDLHALGFAVVPKPLPPGFIVSSVAVDKRGRKYTIVYERQKDKAELTFEGEGNAGRAEPKKGGIFGSISDTFDKATGQKTEAEKQTASMSQTVGSEETTPAIEAERTDVVSDSPLIGPIHFTNDGACFSGSPDATKADITEAHFTVTACNLRAPDPMIRAYKSLAKI